VHVGDGEVQTWMGVTGTCTTSRVNGTRSRWLHVAEDLPTAGNVLKPPQISFEILRAVAKGARDSTMTSSIHSRWEGIA